MILMGDGREGTETCKVRSIHQFIYYVKNTRIACECGQVAIKLLLVLTRQDLDASRSRKAERQSIVYAELFGITNLIRTLGVLNAKSMCGIVSIIQTFARLFGTTYHMGSRPAVVMQWYGNALFSRKLKTDRMKLILDVARGLT